jgi:hypothetical protein
MPALFDAVRSMHRKKSGQNQIAGIIVSTVDCKCVMPVYKGSSNKPVANTTSKTKDLHH